MLAPCVDPARRGSWGEGDSIRDVIITREAQSGTIMATEELELVQEDRSVRR